MVPTNTVPRAGLPASRASESWILPLRFGGAMCPLYPSVVPWHCSAVGSSHAQGGRGPVGAAIRLLLGGRICRVDRALPKTQPGCSPHCCLQCQHLREPCGVRTRPDMCFHLAQTMTRPVLGCKRMRLSLDVDLSPVPQADLALAPARGPGHPGCLCSPH